MAITREEVLHVAKLARLELTDDEVERLTGQLGAILEAVSKVSRARPRRRAADLAPARRSSTAGARTSRMSRCSLDQAFANAPAREGDLFKVPPTV